MPTNYAGEGYQIRTKDELGLDGNALDREIVDRVEVEVFSSDYSEEIVPASTMDYDEEIGHWVFPWNTVTVDPGSYKALVTFWFIDGTYSLEGPLRIRLKADPRP